jgi:hypothetical protein
LHLAGGKEGERRGRRREIERGRQKKGDQRDDRRVREASCSQRYIL